MPRLLKTLYLYYFVFANHHVYWAIPEKIQTGRGGGFVEDILTWNPPGSFHFFTLPLEIPDKTKLNHWIFHKIVLDPLKIPRPKTKTPGNSTLFFPGHPSNFHFILINPCKFHILFLWYPGKSISSIPLFGFFME